MKHYLLPRSVQRLADLFKRTNTEGGGRNLADSTLSVFMLMSWIFLPSTYTHRDGVRVPQYEPLPRIEDPSGPVYTRHYHYQHTHQYGAGSWDDDYQVDRWSRVTK